METFILGMEDSGSWRAGGLEAWRWRWDRTSSLKKVEHWRAESMAFLEAAGGWETNLKDLPLLLSSSSAFLLLWRSSSDGPGMHVGKNVSTLLASTSPPQPASPLSHDILSLPLLTASLKKEQGA